MKHIRSTFFLLTTLFIMASCGEDRSGEYYALVGENVWIEQIMKEHYLWYDSIPAIKETVFINSTLAQLGCNILWKMFRHRMLEHHGLFLNLETMKVNSVSV